MLATICFRLVDDDELGELSAFDRFASSVALRFDDSLEVIVMVFLIDVGDVGVVACFEGLEKYCLMSFMLDPFDKRLFFRLVYFGVFFEVTSCDDARTIC